MYFYTICCVALNLMDPVSPNFTTIEYTLSRTRAPQPVFLYVIDTVISEVSLRSDGTNPQCTINEIPMHDSRILISN